MKTQNPLSGNNQRGLSRMLPLWYFLLFFVLCFVVAATILSLSKDHPLVDRVVGVVSALLVMFLFFLRSLVNEASVARRGSSSEATTDENALDEPISPEEFRSHTVIHETPTCGRVIEIALAGTRSQVVSSRGKKILEQEVAQHCPQGLVINLREFNSIFGNDLLGALVTGAAAMRKLGAERPTRLVAVGKTAAALQRILPLTRLDTVFGPTVHSDFESAVRSMPSIATGYPASPSA